MSQKISHNKVAFLYYLEGYSIQKIADYLGCSYSKVFNLKSEISLCYEKAINNYSKNEESVCKLFYENYSVFDISYLTGYKKHDVLKILDKYGLKPKRTKNPNKKPSKRSHSSAKRVMSKSYLTDEQLRLYVEKYRLNGAMISLVTGLNGRTISRRITNLGLSKENTYRFDDSKFSPRLIVAYVFAKLSIEDICQRYGVSEEYLYQLFYDHEITVEDNNCIPDYSLIEKYEKLEYEKCLYKVAGYRSSWGCDLEFVKQFDDIHKLKFLIRSVTSNQIVGKCGNEYVKPFIKHFYHDDLFNIVYKKYIYSGFKDFMKPSLDHVVPRVKNGSWDFENINYIPYFENISKNSFDRSYFITLVKRYYFHDLRDLGYLTQTETYSNKEYDSLMKRNITHKDLHRRLNDFFECSYEYALKFDDPTKLYFLLYIFRNNRSRLKMNCPEQAKAFIEKFYYDDGFNFHYAIYHFTGNSEDIPSLDHIHPLNYGGSNDLSNLRFISWFENQSKNDWTYEEFIDAQDSCWWMYEVFTRPLAKFVKGKPVR